MATMGSPTKTQENKTDKAKDYLDKGKDAMAGATEKAKDTGESFMDKAKDTASNVASTAKNAASNVGQHAEDATHAVGSGFQSFAGTIRDNLPKEGMLGSAASSVAQGLETSGKYLEKEGLQGIAEDMTSMIRRNPIPALLVAVGIGFLLARATTMNRS